MIATTVEQSRHLLELGLDPNTADMWWSNRFVSWQPTPMEYIATERNQLYTFKWCESDVPAWSLSALLEVMPGDVKVDGEQYYHHLEKNNGFYIVSYYFDDVDELYTLNTTKVCETPIDAAYEMICWLLEQGLIKKGGQDD